MTTQKAIERSSSNTLPTHQTASDAPIAESARGQWYYSPHADIFETADAFTIVLDMPGVTRENVEITCEDRVLVVHGRVNPPLGDDSRRSIRTEYGIGDYYRRFELGDTIDSDRISAETSLGVVTVHLPKVEHARPIRITVSEK